ncbi:MAG: GntR family transcriptional regulator, partial [Frankiales bacterium]|nr:GntR family transcriptional regulator [Frankiales bacterium]
MLHLSAPALARLLPEWRGAAPGRPGYAALAAAVRALVLDGRVAVGARLPAERDLAGQLGVSRTTVTAAYDALRASGHAVSRQGAGTFAALPAGARASWSDAGPGLLDLALASPEPLPGLVEGALERAAPRLARHLRATGYVPPGLPELREALAARCTARGVPTTADQVLVTSGAMGALALAGRLLAPGDRVLADGPTYPNALEALRAGGGRVASVPLLPDGWDVEAHAAAYRQVGPTLAYLVADFHNPTGLVLDAPGREALVAAAARNGVSLLVDETLADLALEGQQLPPPVAAYDEDGRVLTVGSMSKSHWGGLRVGWLRGPADVVARLVEARAAVDLAPPVLDQLVALELLADDTAVARRQRQVAERRDVALEALGAQLPDWEVRRPAGGLSL